MNKKQYSNEELLRTIEHWRNVTRIFIGKALEDDHDERLEAIKERLKE